MRGFRRLDFQGLVQDGEVFRYKAGWMQKVLLAQCQVIAAAAAAVAMAMVLISAYHAYTLNPIP